MVKTLFLSLILFPFFPISSAVSNTQGQHSRLSEWKSEGVDTWYKVSQTEKGTIFYIIVLEREFLTMHEGIVQVMRLSNCPDGGTEAIKWTYDEDTGVSLSCDWKKSKSVDIPDFFEKDLAPFPPKINRIIENRKAELVGMKDT